MVSAPPSFSSSSRLPRQPTATNQLPPTNCHQPIVNNQLPPTSCHQPIATHQLPFVTNQLSSTNCHQPIATHHLSSGNCHPPIVTQPVVNNQLSSTHQPIVTNQLLPMICLPLVFSSRSDVRPGAGSPPLFRCDLRARCSKTLYFIRFCGRGRSTIWTVVKCKKPWVLQGWCR